MQAQGRKLEATQRDYENAKLALIQTKLFQLGLPKMKLDSQEKSLQKLAYPGYVVGFSKKHRQPQWSAHIIPRDIFEVCLNRQEEFFEDLSVVGAARLLEYSSSKYQRGHMAPAADFRWSPKASAASNILSNISPQPKDLNEGLWAQLEISIRQYLQLRDSVPELWVVTGPVLGRDLKKLKDTTAVSIPKQFFKVVLNLQDKEGYAFLMDDTAKEVKDEKLESELRKWAMSIDALEGKLGIDFFPNLNAGQEKTMESTLDMDGFFIVPGKTLDPLPSPVTKEIALKNTASNTTSLTKRDKAVIGTVVRISRKPGVETILYLDQVPPRQRVTVHIAKQDAEKFKFFSWNDLLGKVMRIEGDIIQEGDKLKVILTDRSKLTRAE